MIDLPILVYAIPKLLHNIIIAVSYIKQEIRCTQLDNQVYKIIQQYHFITLYKTILIKK
jgi:hypothetical protein